MTVSLDIPGWRARAMALADQLADAGVLTEPSWRMAIEQTPRHVFVPRFYRDDRTIVDCADPASATEWLDEVYRDDSLVTQIATVPGTDLDLYTSSSTMPSLMARMLELLEVDDATTVLEIGTATGYNAALLCHRLGSDNVASIELHPTLAADAATRLRKLGYHPTLATGDGADGLPCAALYDRVLATCAVAVVPPAWIAQLSRGGRIVTDLRSGLSSNLAVLDKIDADTVQGRLTGQPGHFMWLRPDPDNPLPDGRRWDLIIDHAGADTASTDLDLALLNEPGLRLVLGILEPGLRAPSRARSEQQALGLRTDDNSWAEITVGTEATVVQGGPRRIWPAVERAATRWLQLGRPAPDRFGVTATIDGAQRYWLDQPDQLIFDASARPNEVYHFGDW